MTQSLIIDPNEVRRPGYVKFPEVPVNQYTFDRDTEIARYGEKGMVQMLHDMIVVRTFESMLDSIKKTGRLGRRRVQPPRPRPPRHRPGERLRRPELRAVAR